VVVRAGRLLLLVAEPQNWDFTASLFLLFSCVFGDTVIGGRIFDVVAWLLASELVQLFVSEVTWYVSSET